MMRQYELVEKVANYNPHTNEELINKAYVYAMRAHGHQIRASGDPYFSHPLEVANILTSLKLDDATIVTALLHDTIEDTDVSSEDLRNKFGDEIADLVEGVTKIEKLDLVSKEYQQAENLKKLLIGISKDIRVLLVKIADRLHNMRTLHYINKPEKRLRISEETLDIYAPFAKRLGMHEISLELEDLAFKNINPDMRDTIISRLNDLSERRGVMIENIESNLKVLMERNGISANIYGRLKAPYSIWRKMEVQEISFHQLSDIYAFRIITKNIDDCYRSLGVVHQNWRMVPERFKDFISLPKENEYRTIHTTLIGDRGQRIELQIRTEQMDDVAERGIAAHAFYKEANSGAVPLSKESSVYIWLRDMVDRLVEGETPEQLLKHTKLELFNDQVFSFSPKGRVIALPRGANAIDFAYAVHTDIGHNCVGAKINGNIVPLQTKLKNGDEVEIITEENHIPPEAWANIVVSAKAQAAIKRINAIKSKEKYKRLGLDLIEQILLKNKLDVDAIEAISLSINKFSRGDVNSVLEDVGKGIILPNNVLKIIQSNYIPHKNGAKKDETKQWIYRKWADLSRSFTLPIKFKDYKNNSKNLHASLPLRNVSDNDYPIKIGTKYGVLPGERIIGILSDSGGGVIVYPIDSKKLEKYEDRPDEWIDMSWDIDEDNPSRFPATIEIIIRNKVGALAQITNKIADLDANIENLELSHKRSDFYNMIITMELFDIKHLNLILRHLRRIKSVTSVKRLKDEM